MSDRTYASLDDWFEGLPHWDIHHDDAPFERGPIQFEQWFLGRYEVEDLIGFGQTSIVFRSTDTRLEREVALKIWHGMDPGVEPPLLLRECRLLARIEYPLIVRVYDFGDRHDAMRPWAALEYVPWPNLRAVANDLLKDSTETVLRIGRQLADILTFLHRNVKIYQLDLKLDDVTYDAQTHRVKLIDLGSARIADRESTTRFGTPGYIAPEMFDSRQIDEKCDIFSLGVMLHELITRKNPFVRVHRKLTRRRSVDFTSVCWDGMESARMGAVDDIRRFHQDRLSIEGDLQAFSVPQPISKLISKMCAYEPEVRPNAQEVAAALDVVLTGRRAVASVFISHAHADKERFVTRFAESLRMRGMEVWLDNWRLRTGEPFWERIGQAIIDADFFIVVLSHSSLDSPGVLEELRTAQLLNLSRVKILPIRIDPVSFSAIPVHLRSRQILDFVGWEDERIYSDRISTLIADMLALSSQRQ